MFPDGLETLKEYFPKVLEILAVLFLQHFHIFLVELKRNRMFEAFARTIRNEEAKVNVDDVCLLVNKDVAIVSILHLEEIA